MSWFTAPPKSQRWVYALSALVTAGAAPSHAQTVQKRVAHVEDKDAPTIVQAEQISGRPERELILTRNADVVRDQTHLQADTACYRAVEDQVEANGHIKLNRFGDVYTGDDLKLRLDSGQGYITDPTYKFQVGSGQGKAQRVDFLNEDEALVVNGTYSTCEGPNPDWYLKADTLNLDSGRDVGTGSTTMIYFKDVPILYTPGMTFSLSGARRSGWLSPTPGFGSKGGAELLVPYYFNIAPNRDLTVYPKIIAKRGIQLGADARYMGETESGTYAGQTYVEFLGGDKEVKQNNDAIDAENAANLAAGNGVKTIDKRNPDRWMIKSTHTQSVATDWTAGWTLNAASDDNYPNDFSKTVASSTERQLLRELRTDYHGEYWNLTARAQNYQILQDPDAATDPSLTVARPYDRLPSINLHAARFDIGGFDWSFDAEVTRFWHPTLVRGDREVISPQISYPFIRPGYYITPKLMLNASAYQLDDNAVTTAANFTNRTPSVAVPTFSLDSGMVFERDAKLSGQAVTQTLEPRLFYVYTPYRDQSDLPNFDTALATFNMTQIFNENRFVGSDRIGDANQVTAAVVSRFLTPAGGEVLRLTFGQRYYFSDQRVQLTNTTPTNDTRSDLLLAATGRISPTWTFDSAIQYNQGDRQVQTSNYGVSWVPGAKKVLNLAYRYIRSSYTTSADGVRTSNADGIKNIELSGQWPLTQRLYGVARANYSAQDKRLLESLVGLEYKGDCWVFRMGAQRFVTTARNTSTPIFFQLELNGLSGLGIGNPLETLKKSIPGYQSLNPEFNR